MAFTLPLDKMTTAEKLEAMELIWEDLSRHEEDIPAPSWHWEILKEREAAVARGENPSIDWEDAKRWIQDELRYK